MTSKLDRGPVFDGVQVGRPATGGLIDAGYGSLADLPDDLEALSAIHGVGPSAIRRLRAERAERGLRGHAGAGDVVNQPPPPGPEDGTAPG